MALTTGFWQSGATGTAALLNQCLLEYGTYANFPAPAAAPTMPTLTNGTGHATGSPITLAALSNTIAITLQGNFTVQQYTGTQVVVTSGTATVTSSPVSCSNGSNTITVTGTGNILVYVTITAPGNAGMMAWATDQSLMYYSTGAAWVSCSPTLSIAVGGGYDFYGPLANIPTGFHLCDGTNISRSTYSVLYALIGTTYGSGNGSTTFNIPNRLANYAEGVATAGTNPGATSGSLSKTTAGHVHYLTGSYDATNNTGGYAVAQNGSTTSTSTDSISDIRPPSLDVAPIIRII
jgi:microcystin-dependent protein